MAKQEKSLAAATAAPLVPSFAMPAALQAPTSVVSGLVWAPYITFAHQSRKDEWAKLQARFGYQTVKEGQMYFIDGDEMTALDVAKVSLVCATQHWVHKDPVGALLGFSRNPKPDPFREHVEAVVLVYLKDRVTPANVTFRTTKCGGAKAMSDALLLASTPDWGHLSPDHMKTMTIPQPFLRFYANLTLGEPRTPKARPGKPAGLPYRVLNADVRPTTEVEWKALDALSKDANLQNVFDLASNRYESVLAELATKEVN